MKKFLYQIFGYRTNKDIDESIVRFIRRCKEATIYQLYIETDLYETSIARIYDRLVTLVRDGTLTSEQKEDGLIHYRIKE